MDLVCFEEVVTLIDGVRQALAHLVDNPPGVLPAEPDVDRVVEFSIKAHLLFWESRSLIINLPPVMC